MSIDAYGIRVWNDNNHDSLAGMGLILNPYVKNSQVFICPSDNETARWISGLQRGSVLLASRPRLLCYRQQ